VTMRVVLPARMLAGGHLTASDFSLTENGAAITGLSVHALASQREPLEVLLAIDVSGSMKGQALADAKVAAGRFIAGLGTADQVAVISFSDRPSLEASLTTDRTVLRTAIERLKAGRETALYDAVVDAAGSFTAVKGTDRAIVLLSDGGDTVSGNSLGSAANALAQSGVPMYAVALETGETDAKTLRTLARASGGRVVSVAGTTDLADAFGGIASQLTSPYEISFTSTRPPAKSLDYNLVVSSRDGRASLSAAVGNPDTLAAAAAAPAIVPPVPSPAWPLGIAALVFLAAALLTAAVIVLARPEPNALGQLRYFEQIRNDRMKDLPGDDAEDPDSVRGRLVRVAGAVASRGGFEAAIRLALERADLPLRPVEYMTMHVGVVLIGGLVLQFSTRNIVVSSVAVLLLALGPIVLLQRIARRRAEAFQAQLPDVLNLLAGSLRAGWGLLQATGIVVNEIPAPAGPEFERVVTEARLGLPLEEALEKMAVRMGSEDFRWAVTAIAIQREVGGNLAEVLDLVATTVRERAALRRQISSLTAEGRLSEVILIALPFVEATVLYLLNPGYFSQLLSSSLGIAAAGSALLLLAIGILWLRQIVRIEV
jgi:tight adherence protein B